VIRNATRAAGGGAAAGGWLDWCGGGCDGLNACDAAGSDALVGALVGIVVVIVAAILGAVLFWAIRALVRYLREKLRKPVATGAFAAAPKLKASVASVSGVAKNGQLLDTPWREGSAYAWAMELHESRVLGGGAMLRDARTAGFTVQLPDGRPVRVPAGRIRVLSPLSRVMNAEEEKLSHYVDAVDKTRDGKTTLFPHDYARAITIEDGDEVEVVGELMPDPDAPVGGYREAAGGMIPVGVPYLRVKKPEKLRVDPPNMRIADGGAAELLPESELPVEAEADSPKKRKKLRGRRDGE
jgi:hypothetical protein